MHVLNTSKLLALIAQGMLVSWGTPASAAAISGGEASVSD